MGVKIFDLVTPDSIQLKDLSSKVVAVDSFNVLYQFLASIRGADGNLLTDSNGNVTSHLSGLFFRTMNLLNEGIKPVFVFDGKAPELKRAEQKKRREVKEKALEKYKIAKEQNNLDDMKKFASRTSKLTQDMIDESKNLIKAMGLPVVQAPSEGEAQAAFMTNHGDVFASASQDADSLLFGANRLIKNLTLSNRRKNPNSVSYSQIEIEKFELKKILTELEINRDQLIALGILVGTDFNPGGIKGIGPKKALTAVKKFGTDFDTLFNEVKWDEYYDFSYKDIFEIFNNIDVEKNYDLEFSEIDSDNLKSILVDKHEFNLTRIDDLLSKYDQSKQKREQQNLSSWFG